MSILVVEAFVRLRTLIAGNRELAVRVEKLETNQLEISSIIEIKDLSFPEVAMPRCLAALTIVLMIGMVVIRLILLKRQGIAAMKFGETDKTDFLIPPFALFYFYVIFAAALGLPSPSTKELFYSGIAQWLGVALCFCGLTLLLWSFISFGSSFRVGIDTAHPDKLITDGSLPTAVIRSMWRSPSS